jgi:hypothetical protein
MDRVLRRLLYSVRSASQFIFLEDNEQAYQSQSLTHDLLSPRDVPQGLVRTVLGDSKSKINLLSRVENEMLTRSQFA